MLRWPMENEVLSELVLNWKGVGAAKG